MQYLNKVDIMEQFTIELKKETEKASAPLRDYMNQFIPVFFNCRENSGTLLMLGVEDKTLLRNVVGGNADFLIEDNAKYLIHITKVHKKSTRKQVRFSFRELKYSFEEKEHIRYFFRFYGKLTPGIDKQLDNGRLTDTLNIEEPVETICANNKPLIETLSGENLINTVFIDTPFIADFGFLRFVKDIYIVPRDYHHLSIHSSRMEERKDTFWDYLKEIGVSELIPNSHCYNYVFLNSPNDHLLRVFYELIGIYLNDFSLKDAGTEHLLKRIFFVCSDSFNPVRPESASRGKELIQAHSSIFGVLDSNQDKVMSSTMNAELYLALLKILIYKDSQELKCQNELPSLLQVAIEYLSVMEHEVGQHSCNFVEVLDNFQIRYKDIENSIKRLSQCCRDSLEKRDNILQELEIIIENLAKFIGDYSPTVAVELEKISSGISNTKNEVLKQKKFIWMKSYTTHNTKFREYISSYINDLINILESIKTNIFIPTQKLLSDCIFGAYHNKLQQIMTAIPDTGITDIVSIVRSSSVADLKKLFEIESGYSNVINQNLTYEVLTDTEKRHIGKLNHAVSEIRKTINDTSFIFSDYLSGINKQTTYSDSKIRAMLLNEAYSEMNSINS